ncbi:mavicyanin [Andrographis paniculata]|uniref:mavicyanin n=1 Tax=Andrographis paniculata TaxID=175694 RepID=UPI0021E7CED9|nr:mavicyanin [Andrographis paniculata]
MAISKAPMFFQFWYSFLFLVSLQSHKILCSIYQVGDLDAWNIPSHSNPQVYTKWSKLHTLNIGDSLFFLYPPSQDSVIQVTGDSYNSCNLKDPILLMDDGNSLFNLTKPGHFYFISGVEGHCQKSQKLHISVLYGNGSAVGSAADGPAAAPSYPTVFGSIPAQSSPSSSDSPFLKMPLCFMSVAAAVILAFLVAV